MYFFLNPQICFIINIRLYLDKLSVIVINNRFKHIATPVSFKKKFCSTKNLINLLALMSFQDHTTFLSCMEHEKFLDFWAFLFHKVKVDRYQLLSSSKWQKKNHKSGPYDLGSHPIALCEEQKILLDSFGHYLLSL